MNQPSETACRIYRSNTATGDCAWIVSEYGLVRALFSDPRLGRSHPRPTSAARTSHSIVGGPSGSFDNEPQEHDRMRALLRKYFSPRHIKQTTPHVEMLVTRLLDDFERSAPPADLYRLVAYPLPTMVIGDLLGVPARDRAQLLASMNALADGADAERSMRGATELFSYFLTSATRCESGENMLSDLRAQDGVDDLYVAKLASYLLFAGQWATAMEIAAGVSTLLANPRLWQALVDDPAVAPRVVEETLRAPEGITNVLTLPRYARADMAVDGTDIATGDLVLFDLGAANRDPAVFPADHVDLTRASIPPHLRFGAGKYYCVGAPIARVVLQSLYIQLATRFPRLRLVEAVDHATLARGDAVTLSVAW